ncbi:FecCD family ABC transporter permease [Bacillus massilinigeriensis]|uniref:FecCD family ABC transporter permease n=1 Tax=Bacillus mediterraneensis TaxID=1805474 RepID=UPI0008F8B387|nr:iron ABC transporter permease [Bacillus mediterraneensis]
MRKRFTLKFLSNGAGPYFLAVIFLVASMLFALSIGTVSIPISDILFIIGREVLHLPVDTTAYSMNANIIMNIRLPRVILAGLVGASLAIAGAAFQGLLRNPLADPYTLGVSSGASVGAVLTLFFGISIPRAGGFTLPVMGVVFAFITIMLVLLFVRAVDPAMKVESIILTGIIFSSFLGAVISLFIALTGDELRAIIGWLMGSVSMRGWNYISLLLPFFLFGSLLLLLNGRELNALSLGEERAHHLGVNTRSRKLVILIGGSILTGAAVSVSGTIGFVGLVIPHLTRMLWGPDHKHLLPLSILTGGGFLILADLAARMVASPVELPIGVITSVVGAPVFAAILMKKQRERRGMKHA